MTRKEKKSAKVRFKKTYRYPPTGEVMARLVNSLGNIRRVIARLKAKPVTNAMGFDSAAWWQMQPKATLELIHRERSAYG